LNGITEIKSNNMDKKFTIEGNAKIAKFMKWETSYHDAENNIRLFKIPTDWLPNDEVVKEYAAIEAVNMKFDSSMEWIQPVLDKIKTRIIYGTTIGNSISIITYSNNNQYGFSIENGVYFNEVLTTSHIESAYKLVLDFIDWYITNKKLGDSYKK
jgi:hypothetical protein